MNATATATKFVAPTGMGVWDSEAEFVANYNATMRDSGIAKRITSAAELNVMRVSVPARTDMPSKVDRDSLPQRERNGNTNGSGAKRGNGATPKQLEWLIKMDGKKAENAEVDAITAKAVAGEFVTFDEAKKALDYVFDRSVAYRTRKPAAPVAAPVAQVAAKPATPVAQRQEVTEGMWTEVEGDRIFKIIDGENGRYATELVNGKFEYERGLICKLPKVRPMTIDEAKHYGKVTGTCCVCARKLRNPVSIEAGIGPKCAQRF